MEKKLGRPTDAPKDTVVRVRFDSQSLDILNSAAEITEKSRSEIIRGIFVPEVLPSQEFDNMLSINSLNQLNEKSIECSKYFNQLAKDGTLIEERKIQRNFPAFCEYYKGSKCPSKLYVKKPTYVIRVADKRYSFEYKEIEDILNSNHSLSQSDFFLSINPCCFDIVNRKQISLAEVTCLKDSFAENTKLAREIGEIFKQNSISYELWPSYVLYPRKIEVIETKSEDGNVIDYIKILEIDENAETCSSRRQSI